MLLTTTMSISVPVFCRTARHVSSQSAAATVNAEMAAINRLRLSLTKRQAADMQAQQLQQQMDAIGSATFQDRKKEGFGDSSSTNSTQLDRLFPSTTTSAPFRNTSSVIPSFVTTHDTHFKSITTSEKAAMIQKLRDIKRDRLVEAMGPRTQQNLEFLEQGTISTALPGLSRTPEEMNRSGSNSSSIYPAFETLLSSVSERESNYTGQSSLLDRSPMFAQLPKYSPAQQVPRDIANSLVLQLNMHCKSNLHFRSFLRHVFDHISCPPAFLICEALAVCRQYQDINMAYSLLAQLKQVGVMNYLSSVTSRVFNELLKTSWTLEQDVEKLRLVLQEARNVGLDVDKDTVKLFKAIKQQLEDEETLGKTKEQQRRAAQMKSEYWAMLLDMNMTHHFSTRRNLTRSSKNELAQEGVRQ